MNNKVLIIGPDFHNYNESIGRAFRCLGFDTKIYSYDRNFFSIINRIERKIDKLLKMHFYKRNVLKYNAEINDIYNKFRPNIVLVIKGEIVLPETLINMNKSLMVCWMQDSIFRFKQCMNNIEYYNHIFVFEKTDLYKLDERGIIAHFLPMAVDTSIYFPLATNRDIDISFVGAIKGDRIQLLRRLVMDMPHLNIQYYGYCLPSFSLKESVEHFISKRYKYFNNINISPEKASIIYSRSKIALNNHIAQSQYGCNPRLFEILATNTFQLVDSNTFIDNEFKDMLITYNNYEHMLSLIEKYLLDCKERCRIAQNGYEQTVKLHKYEDRIRLMLETIGYI